MMADSLKISTRLPVSAERLYKAWLNSQEHSAFTGSPAHIDPAVGGKYTAWDGYIQGKNLELEPYHRILQTWWTTDFPNGSPASRLEVVLEETQEGTRITLVQSGLPEGTAGDYLQGWKDYYFKPMKDYFQTGSGEQKG